MKKSIHPLRRWRFEHGMTLIELATAVHASVPHMSDIERWRKYAGPMLAKRLGKISKLDPKLFVRN